MEVYDLDNDGMTATLGVCYPLENSTSEHRKEPTFAVGLLTSGAPHFVLLLPVTSTGLTLRPRFKKVGAFYKGKVDVPGRGVMFLSDHGTLPWGNALSTTPLACDMRRWCDLNGCTQELLKATGTRIGVCCSFNVVLAGLLWSKTITAEGAPGGTQSDAAFTSFENQARRACTLSAGDHIKFIAAQNGLEPFLHPLLPALAPKDSATHTYTGMIMSIKKVQKERLRGHSHGDYFQIRFSMPQSPPLTCRTVDGAGILKLMTATGGATTRTDNYRRSTTGEWMMEEGSVQEQDVQTRWPRRRRGRHELRENHGAAQAINREAGHNRGHQPRGDSFNEPRRTSPRQQRPEDSGSPNSTLGKDQ
jgi:hypothetical protein